MKKEGDRIKKKILDEIHSTSTETAQIIRRRKQYGTVLNR